MFTYDSWIHVQAKQVEAKVRELGFHGITDAAVYVFPSQGSQAGRLLVSTEQPEGATDVLSFPAVGTCIAAVPYPHMYNAIWNACRRMPICPTA